MWPWKKRKPTCAQCRKRILNPKVTDGKGATYCSLKCALAANLRLGRLN